MTLDDIAALPREFLRAEDVAPYIGIHPQSIRSQAQADPSKLGFPVIVHGTRVKIPRDGFVYFCKYGHLPQNRNRECRPGKQDHSFNLARRNLVGSFWSGFVAGAVTLIIIIFGLLITVSVNGAKK